MQEPGGQAGPKQQAAAAAPALASGLGAAAAGALAPAAAPAPPGSLAALASACVALYHICTASGEVASLRAAGPIMPSEVVPGQQPLASPRTRAPCTVSPTRKRPRTLVTERKVGSVVAPAAWPAVDEHAQQVPAGTPAEVGAGGVCLRGAAADGLIGRELERLRGYTVEATAPGGGKWVLQFIPDTRQQERRPLVGSARAAGRAAADPHSAPSGGCAGCACASGAGAQSQRGAAEPGAAGAGGSGAGWQPAPGAAGLDAAGGGAAGVTHFPLPTLVAFESMHNVLKRWAHGDRECGRTPIEAAWKEGRIPKKRKQRVGELRQLVQIMHERAGAANCTGVIPAADIAQRLNEERLAARDERGLPVPFAKFAKGVIVEWRNKRKGAAQ